MQIDQQKDDIEQSPVTALDAIVLIGLLFSCCFLPIALMGLVFASTWLATNASLAPYRPLLLVGAIFAIFFFAYRKLYFSRAQCASRTSCIKQRAGFGAQVVFLADSNFKLICARHAIFITILLLTNIYG